MKPSRDAIDIDLAHKLLKLSLGTAYEPAARRNLEAVVELVKAKRRPS